MCLYVYECALIERWVYVLCYVSCMSFSLPIVCHSVSFPIKQNFKATNCRQHLKSIFRKLPRIQRNKVSVVTFKLGLEDRGRFGSQEDFLGVLGEHTLVACRENELAQEAGPVADVIVLVVLGQVEHVLAQQLCLTAVGYHQLRCQVQNL